MRRTPRLVVHDRDAVFAAVVELQPAALVVDVQPFVAPWGCSPEAMVSAAVALSEYLAEEMPNLKTVVFATNARPVFHQLLREERPRVTFVSAARKPWRIAYVGDVPRPVVVLGDQIITDGLLAFRLHGQFLHWRVRGRIPCWPRLQAIIGEVLVQFLFSPMHSPTSASNQARSAQ
jgi:hypothetical protein